MDLTPEQAQEALARAAESSRRVRSRASSVRVYSWVNALAWAASLIAYGFIGPWAIRLPVWFLLLAVPLLAVVRWNMRRPASAVDKPPPRGGYGAYTWPMCGVEALAVIIGEVAHLHGRLAFWLPAAILVALPLTILGFRVGRP
jgi:fatty acid desaturase